MARSLNKEANTCLMATMTESIPRTFRNVSCWPANDASGISSAVADERTANETSADVSPCSWLYASRMAWSRLGWNGVSIIHWRISAPTLASVFTSSTSSVSKMS